MSNRLKEFQDIANAKARLIAEGEDANFLLLPEELQMIAANQRIRELEAEIAQLNASLGMAWKTAYGRIDTIQDKHKSRAEAAEKHNNILAKTVRQYMILFEQARELSEKWRNKSVISVMWGRNTYADELEALLKGGREVKRKTYPDCGCEVLEGFDDYCPLCRLTNQNELLAEVPTMYRRYEKHIAELENNRDYWRESCMSAQQHRDGANAKLKEFETRAEAAEAKLAAAVELVQEWRDLTHDEQCHSLMPIAQICEDCADELEALLKEEE